MKTAEVVGQPRKKPPVASTPRPSAVNVKKQGKNAEAPRTSETDIHRLIQMEAYFHYEKRGFKAGTELQDWLDAEREVRRMTDVERRAEPF